MKEVLNMAIAKKEGKDGIDRWTSNGYGLTVEPKKKADGKDDNKKENEKIRKYLNGSK